jgi:hypothetical protein
MSKIALVVSSLGNSDAKCLSLLMNSFGVSLGALRASLAKRDPVVERELFDRSDPTFPQRLLGVLEQLELLGCTSKAFELLEGQAYVPTGRYVEVTPNHLRTMIATRDVSLAEQRRLGELQNGDQ